MELSLKFKGLVYSFINISVKTLKCTLRTVSALNKVPLPRDQPRSGSEAKHLRTEGYLTSRGGYDD